MRNNGEQAHSEVAVAELQDSHSGPASRAAERAADRAAERGAECGADRGADRAADRGADRGADGGYSRVVLNNDTLPPGNYTMEMRVCDGDCDSRCPDGAPCPGAHIYDVKRTTFTIVAPSHHYEDPNTQRCGYVVVGQG